jgi:hypothetical protein
MRIFKITLMILPLVHSELLEAAVTQFENKMEWQQAVGSNFTTIGFNDLPPFTFLTTQYASVGVLFDGSDDVYQAEGFLNDGWGVDGNGDIFVNFTQPMYYVACDFPGLLQYKLYFQNQLIFTSSVFFQQSVGNFAGLISTTPFDRAQLIDPAGEAAIDDLFFGPPIPAPGAFLPFALCAALAPKWRRR